MRIATYNIHGCIGRGGRYAPDRIAAVLKEISADIIALQEVDTRRPYHQGLHQLEYLMEETGLAGAVGPAIQESHGDYGNVLLTRLPLGEARIIDLSISRREPRGALDVELSDQNGPLRVITTHLGLGARERREQIALLLSMLGDGPRSNERTLLMGDFNIWWLAGHKDLPALAARFSGHYGGRSFPTIFPMLTLDRIFVHPAPVRAKARVHASAAARAASDHLPLVVDLAWPMADREDAASAAG